MIKCKIYIAATICPGSSDPFYIKTTAWTHSTYTANLIPGTLPAQSVTTAVRNTSAVLKQPVFSSSSTQLISKKALFSLLQTTTAAGHPAKTEHLNLQQSITILGQPPIRPVTAAGSAPSVIFSKLPVAAGRAGKLMLAGGGRHLCLRQLLPDGQAVISAGGFSAGQFPVKFDSASKSVDNPIKPKNMNAKQELADKNSVVQPALSIENLNNHSQREEVILAPAEPVSADISGTSSEGDISAGIDVEGLDIQQNILPISQQGVKSGKI